MKHTSTINKMILSKKLAEDQLDKKTYKSLKAYKDTHLHQDDRWNFAHMLKTSWPGGPVEQYGKNKMPLFVEVKGIKYYLDYGRGQNKIFKHL